MAEVEKGTRFDIILLDVLMPGENGMAAAREIREYDSNVKIIFLTSSTEFAVESYAVDAWYYQLKPIRREDFFRLMDSACAACTREQKHSLILRSKSGIVRLELKELVYWRQGPQLEAALQANHVKHVYRVFNNAPHVCGIGTGTDAENWLVEATAFWEEQCA